jgi:signal transduction histidine kinase
MDATVFGIGIVNEKNHSLDFPGVKEKDETLDFLNFSLDDDLRLSTYCIKNKKEIFINDFEQEYKKYLPSITPPGKSGNSSSIIYLPLVRDKKATGVITVQSFKKNAYTEYHLSILRNLAVYTKIALENTDAYKKIQKQTENLKIANENISRQKLEIEKVNKELVDLNEEKNLLIEIVAHDLRNPLTSSLSIANNLQTTSGKLDEDDKDNISFLVGALERMNQMILKILDIRMIEQKKVNLNCEKIDFGQVLQEVFLNFEEIARQKNIRLHLQNNQYYGIADRNYLIQIFENLFSNAIKFSPRTYG